MVEGAKRSSSHHKERKGQPQGGGVALGTESESRLFLGETKETILRNQSETSQADGCMEQVQEKQHLVRGHLH